MTHKLKLIPLFILAAGIAVVGFAQGVPMQTVKDSAHGNRLIINGQPLFISGMNIAWITGSSFSNDVGDRQLNESGFRQHVQNIKSAGGNAVRWWLHTDAANCPKINSSGRVTGIGSQTINNIRRALDIAYENGVVVALCLFSFDLLHEVRGSGSNPNSGNKSAEVGARNHLFLTESANLDSYIENALRPILAGVGNHPAIMCWEVFNEPEGMVQGHGWSDIRIDYSHVRRFTGKIAAEVHRNPNSRLKMVSTGIHNFSRTSYFNNYTDAMLREAAGGDELAFLDFYMAHYYPEHNPNNMSPFHNPASFWQLNKPMVIGEFPARSWGPGTGYSWGSAPSGGVYDIVAAYEYAYNNGYAGAMSWSMTEGNTAKFGNFATTRPALENLYSKYRADIEIKAQTLSVQNDKQVMPAISRTPIATVNDRILSVNPPTDADMNIRVVDVKGKTVARFKGAGDAQFSLAKIPAGRYIVETTIAGKRVGSDPVVVR